MDIYAKPGTKIQVTERSIKNGGDSSKKGLEVGKIYTVKKIIVGNWSSEVQLEELNGYFNTVLFENL